MRILICHRPAGAFGYISDGWLNALQRGGHEAQRWDGDPYSWEQFDPQLYIGCSGHRQPIPQRRGECKLALHVNPWGPVPIAGIDESEQARQWVLQQRPDCVFGYGHEADQLFWSYWSERAGIPWVPMPTAGDTTVYGDHEIARRWDVAYVGGYWPYKGQSLAAYLLPVLRQPQITARVHGWGEWPQEPWYGGAIADHQVAGLYSAAAVVPCIAEPHTHRWGLDLPERVFKAALCGALPIHDAVPGVQRFCPSLPVASRPQDLLELCLHYSRPEQAEARTQLARQVQQEVLQQHTYQHRMATLLTRLGWAEAVSQLWR